MNERIQELYTQAVGKKQPEPQITHNEECWRWHHECAVAKIEGEFT